VREPGRFRGSFLTRSLPAWLRTWRTSDTMARGSRPGMQREHTVSAADPLNDAYDEFGLLHENAEEIGLALAGQPTVERRFFTVQGGQRLSAVVWGDGPPELVLLHGGGQNAHTWDTVALVLERPLVAFDLPGHGHSDRRPDRDYGPWRNAEAVAEAMLQLVPRPRAVVGMSLGGVTTIRLAATRPELVARAVIVDVTPQVNDPTRKWSAGERGATTLVTGPPIFDSFEAMVEAAVATSPNRPSSAVRRGVRHNATRLPDGRWTWRYDLFRDEGSPSIEQRGDFTDLWRDVSEITAPVMLVVGGDSVFVTEEDVAEFRRRQPSVRVETVAGSGHAIQSDRPRELVGLIEDFAALR
jgi:pimeloyl-ACP methyl ester carboxylesterase